MVSAVQVRPHYSYYLHVVSDLAVYPWIVWVKCQMQGCGRMVSQNSLMTLPIIGKSPS